MSVSLRIFKSERIRKRILHFFTKQINPRSVFRRSSQFVQKRSSSEPPTMMKLEFLPTL